VRINARVIDDPDAGQNAILAEPSELSSEASLRSLLRDHWTLDSAMSRHALRMAIATAGTLLLVHALALEHGYWATLTCLVIMQPHGAATWTKALQRVLGTILGAGLATLVASLVHAPLALTACVFAFVALGTALLPLNYGAYAIFLTPGLVLLAEGHAGGLSLASVRIVNTLLGAGIALVGSRLLFPLAERDQFRPLMAAGLRELKRLLEIAASEHPDLDQLSRARRSMGLALLNAEASYQRLLTEARFAPEESEACSSLLLYVHRLASGLIALALAEGTAPQRGLRQASSQLMAALEDLADAVSMRRPPADLQPAAHESAPRVALLFAQLDVLRSAVQRWHSA
jgi:uncharacterized membrane protein YccC